MSGFLETMKSQILSIVKAFFSFADRFRNFFEVHYTLGASVDYWEQ